VRGASVARSSTSPGISDLPYVRPFGLLDLWKWEPTAVTPPVYKWS